LGGVGRGDQGETGILNRSVTEARKAVPLEGDEPELEVVEGWAARCQRVAKEHKCRIEDLLNQRV
jgi:hypothetical protein